MMTPTPTRGRGVVAMSSNLKTTEEVKNFRREIHVVDVDVKVLKCKSFIESWSPLVVVMPN
jgi:hypothetical protein